MKENIHPNYTAVHVQCSCGYKFTTRSTYPGDELRIEVCSECHPFYTGKHKIVDTEGRVDQFMRRYVNKQSQTAKTQEPQEKAPSIKAKPKSTTTKATTRSIRGQEKGI